MIVALIVFGVIMLLGVVVAIGSAPSATDVVEEIWRW